MAIRFGEIRAEQILENEFKIAVLEKTLSWIVVRNEGRLRLPTPEVMEAFRLEIVSRMKEKYPRSGIEYTPAKQEVR